MFVTGTRIDWSVITGWHQNDRLLSQAPLNWELFHRAHINHSRLRRLGKSWTTINNKQQQQPPQPQPRPQPQQQQQQQSNVKSLVELLCHFADWKFTVTVWTQNNGWNHSTQCNNGGQVLIDWNLSKQTHCFQLFRMCGFLSLSLKIKIHNCTYTCIYVHIIHTYLQYTCPVNLHTMHTSYARSNDQCVTRSFLKEAVGS